MLRSVIAGFSLGLSLHCWSQSDVAGSADHPLFPKRISGFYIAAYRQRDFEQASFSLPTNPDYFKQNVVKGRTTTIQYALSLGLKKPSKLLVKKYYMNAAKLLGATIIFDGEGKEKRSEEDGGLYITDQATLIFPKEGREIWASIAFITDHPESEMAYSITIVDPQEDGKIANSSNSLYDELSAKGRIELYFNFDKAKAFLKPEGEAFVAEIAKMLAEHPEIKLSIEGHTDNRGDAKVNQLLSEKRAEAVLYALVKDGIEGVRLSAKGMGALDPLESNATEEGRALNRRVELVKK